MRILWCSNIFRLVFSAQAVEEMEKLKAQNSKAEVRRKYHIAMIVVLTQFNQGQLTHNMDLYINTHS